MKNNQAAKLASWRNTSAFISFVFAAAVGNLVGRKLQETHSKAVAFTIGLVVFLLIMSLMIQWINRIEKRKSVKSSMTKEKSSGR